MYLVENRSTLHVSFDIILTLLHTVDTFRLMLQKRKLSLTDEKSCFSDGKLNTHTHTHTIRILTLVCYGALFPKILPTSFAGRVHSLLNFILSLTLRKRAA